MGGRTRFPRHGRDGFVLWFVLALACFLFLFMYHITFLSQGEISQLSRTEKFVRCELATRSVYNEIAASLKVNPWTERPFRAAGKSYDGEFNGVRYSALVENTKGVPRSADIWITAEDSGVKRTVFYRIAVAYSILQKMNVITPVFFTFADPDKYGSKDRVARLRERVDEVLGSREEKRLDTEKLAKKIQSGTSGDAILADLQLGGEKIVKAVPPPPVETKKGEPAPPPPAEGAPANLGVAFNPVRLNEEMYSAPPKVKQTIPPSKNKRKIDRAKVAQVLKQFQKLPPAPAPLKGPIPATAIFIDNTSVKIIQTIEKKAYGKVREHGTAVLDANNQVVSIEPTGNGSSGGTNVPSDNGPRPSEDPATTPLGGTQATVIAVEQEQAASGGSEGASETGGGASPGTEAAPPATTAPAQPPLDEVITEAPQDALPTSSGEKPELPSMGAVPLAAASEDITSTKPPEGTAGTDPGSGPGTTAGGGGDPTPGGGDPSPGGGGDPAPGGGDPSPGGGDPSPGGGGDPSPGGGDTGGGGGDAAPPPSAE